MNDIDICYSYRIYFKLQLLNLNPRCLSQEDKGETTILSVHSKDDSTTTYYMYTIKKG